MAKRFDLVAITLLAEPNTYAAEKLLKRKKKPIRRILFCCVEADNQRFEEAYSVIDAHYDDFVDMVGESMPVEEIADRMTKLLSEAAGLQIRCVPIEESCVIELGIRTT